MKTIAITGSSGFVGTNIKKRFESKGFTVIAIQREELNNIDKLKHIIEVSDYIINLAGANIIQRWNSSYKKILYSSRIDTTRALIEAISKANKKPEIFISTSAVGIYKNETCYDEENYDYSDDFLAGVCKEWEKEALKAKEFDIRTAIFRFGIVLGEGGALNQMLTPFKLGLGGTIGDGNQYFSFIHIEDLLDAYEFVLENRSCDGVFNLTVPNPTTNKGLTKALGKSLSRPTIFPLPKFVLQLIFSEGAQVLTNGQCVKPKRLIDKGFDFKFKTIEETIDNLVSKKANSLY